MTFALDPRQLLDRALQAAALAELDRALARLECAAPGREDIHDARKSSKKLRAWLRLLKPSLKRRYRLVDGLLRDGARHLAARRDIEVAGQTLLRLRRGRHLTAAEFRMLERALARLHPPSSDARDIDAARALYTAARVYLAEAAPAADIAQLRKRLACSQAKCRRGLRRASASRAADDLHAWRKQIKYYGYQCALVAPVIPEALSPVVALKSLGEILGLHHDFHLLGEHLERCPPQTLPAALRQHAQERVRQRMDRLARDAIRLGEVLFEPEHAPRR